MGTGDSIRAVMEEEISDINQLRELVRDPLALGVMIHLLIEERKRTNALLQEILKEIRKLQASRPGELADLSEKDEKIVELIRERGMVTAEDVMKELGYKAQNGASARLNSLYRRGILKKVRRGRKVYFALA